jgi:Family of unknown function (DUF6526)
MPTQTYATHRHNPKLTGIGTLFLLVAIVGFALRAYGVGSRREMMALGLFGLIACNFVLLFISRAYTTRLQDRIIKLEMRVRGAALLTPSQQAILAKLDKPQQIALRFASDAELPALVEQADRERLSADQIKRAVKNWVPDWDRT